MSSSDGVWTLEGFPGKVECPADSAGEVQQAYERWKEACAVDPYRDAAPLDAGATRYLAVVKRAFYVDEHSIEQQLMCDYDIRPGSWGRPGSVVYVDSGFVPSPDQPD
jgi:hypothetical protein